VRVCSAKAKGRRLQQQVASDLQKLLKMGESDIRSSPMSSGGCDVWLSKAARERLPFCIECKNREAFSIWSAIDQAEANAKQHDLLPMVVFSKNRRSPWVAIPWKVMLDLLIHSGR
jgi:hypothetical protein